VITYRVTLDVPLQLVIKVSNLLRKRRKELGTRNGTRALTCYQQAVFILAWFRDRPGLSRLGQGFGISQATAYRYKDEGVEVLRALAPTLHDILEKIAEQGLPYLILDGTLIASDRCSDKKTSKKGTEIDKWYSGKAHHHAGLVQALTGPSGIPLWVSAALPGSTHDITAARQLVLPEAPPLPEKGPDPRRLRLRRRWRRSPRTREKTRNGELDINTKTRNMLLRGARYQGERAFALMSQRWRAIRHVSADPSQIGDIAKSVLVLTQFEHKMIS
jgi:hypothetical protein